MTFWLTEIISGLIAEVSIFLAMLDIDEPQQAPEIEAGTQTTGDNAFPSARSTHTCSELNQQFRLYLMASSAIRQNGAIRPPEPFQADPDLGRGGTEVPCSTTRASLFRDRPFPVPRRRIPCSICRENYPKMPAKRGFLADSRHFRPPLSDEIPCKFPVSSTPRRESGSRRLPPPPRTLLISYGFPSP